MRLIDADQFKAKLLGLMDRKALTPSDSDCILDGVLNLLDEQPTIDPVKHGRWNLDENEKIPRYQIKTCSLCGCRVNGTQFNFCPRCGAKMDGEAEC